MSGLAKLRTFCRDEQAATAVEYAVMLALILAVILAAVTTFGEGLGGSFADTQSTLFPD